MSRKQAAHKLAAEYLQHVHITQVYWFPSAPDDIVRLMLVFQDDPPNRYPLKLSSRAGDFETSIASVNESGWAEIAAGQIPLWDGWEFKTAISVGVA